MDNEDVDTAESILRALAEPEGNILVCLTSATETTKVVDFLRRENYDAYSMPDAETMLNRAIATQPHMLIVAKETAAIGISDLVYQVRHVVHWPDDYDNRAGRPLSWFRPDQLQQNSERSWWVILLARMCTCIARLTSKNCFNLCSVYSQVSDHRTLAATRFSRHSA